MRLRQSIFTTLVALCCCLPLPRAAAQDPSTAPVVLEVEPLVEQVEEQVREIKLLTERLEVAGPQDRNPLLYRRDLRSLELVKLMDELTPRVMALPEADPQRIALVERLRGDLADISRSIFERTEDLDARIDKQTASLEELTGVERIEGEAYLKGLEELRYRYYEALIAFSQRRQGLGLPELSVLKNLPQELFQYAEIQVGKVEFAGAAIKELQKRVKVRPDQAELSGALEELRIERARHMGDLRMAIELMDQLGLDSTPYRTVILQQGDMVSISLFDTGVFLGMVRDSWRQLRQTLVENAPDGVFRFLLFIATLMLFFWFARAMRRLVRSGLDRSSLNISTLLKDILVSVSGGTVLMLGFLMALSQMGISLGPMLAGLGVAGFIVGFALQDTLSNFASGAMILIYRPYDVDDYVEVAGVAGLVKKMTLVSTTIATFDNQILVVPNNKIWGDVIKNVTQQRVRRVDLMFGISYSDDIPRTEAVLQDVVTSHEKVLRSPEPAIKVHSLGDSSVNIAVRPWVRTEDYWDVYWDLTRAVKMRFDEEGITIPFPQRDVHFYQST
ncbi:mechanosensitive ion channel domain-containing protein [Parahaliea mediterranea]|uniref:Small-conductance mechanosensitive channel n=1 Tax=Parahaliea mediterranea TaxID=651086 RepID=A0A939DDI0_9GAMM|nr:mechanosensitive ion channel [Parahaliea mediterranea]